MTQTEKDIERKLRDMVKRHGGLCLKWVCPGWSGVPDRIVIMPHGRVYFVELKRPKGGVVSRLQTWWANKLRELDFWVLHIHNDTQIGAFEIIIQHGEEKGTRI